MRRIESFHFGDRAHSVWKTHLSIQLLHTLHGGDWWIIDFPYTETCVLCTVYRVAHTSRICHCVWWRHFIWNLGFSHKCVRSGCAWKRIFRSTKFTFIPNKTINYFYRAQNEAGAKFSCVVACFSQAFCAMINMCYGSLHQITANEFVSLDGSAVEWIN